MLIAADVSLQFARLGHDVIGIHVDAEDALKTMEHNRPDVVVLNIGTSPDSNGLMLGRQLVDSLQIPVVFLSAHVDTPTLKRAYDIGPLGFIFKPFDLKELEQTLRIVQLRLMDDRKV